MHELRSHDALFSRYEAARRIADSTGAPLDVDPPVVAGRYVLEARVGAGQFGSVYRAHDRKLRRAVALKTTSPSGNTEALALAKLRHPNVVTIYDHGVADGCGYLVLELLSGQTLDAWRRAEPRSTSEILSVYIEAGRGLAAAHLAGIVHRDFKPDNVMVCEDGRVVVVDFGIAASSGRRDPDGVGTPAYMAPEQIAGGSLGAASDQFSFCVALWQAVTGSAPFFGATIVARMESILAGPREPFPPGRLGRALRRGLSVSPEHRWPSMSALLSEIAACERGRRRRPLVAGVAAVATAALAWGLVPMGGPSPAAADETTVALSMSAEALGGLAGEAARDDRPEDALILLDLAHGRARGRTERLAVAEAADEVGLRLYRIERYNAALRAHSVAWYVYRTEKLGALERRSLELARTTEDAMRGR